MQKSTTFIIALCALLSFSISSSAQRHCNLSVKVTSPINNSTVSSGDTINFGFYITNNGPAPLLAGDTIIYFNSLAQGFFFTKIIDTVASGVSVNINPSKVILKNDSTIDVTVKACITLLGQQTGVTNITFIDTDTSNDWSCANVVVKHKGTTAINELGKNTTSTLKLYPNPASSAVKFNMDLEYAEKIGLSVKDITGREVMSQNFGTVHAGKDIPFEINVAGLHSGIYLIELNTEHGKSIGKISVTH